jgi:CRP-like cAMP-binding protein
MNTHNRQSAADKAADTSKTIVSRRVVTQPLLLNGPAHPTPAQIRNITVFSGLAEDDLNYISSGLIYRYIPQGEHLFCQGADADSAFFILNGTMSAVSALPASGEVKLADLGPGSMVGVTSLITSGERPATITAETDVAGFLMNRQFLGSAIAQASPAAGVILGNFLDIMCKRMRTQYGQIIEHDHLSYQWISYLSAPNAGPGIKEVAVACPYAFRTYLSQLGFFSEFYEEEIFEMESLGQCLDVARGTELFAHAEHPNSCFFVIRGALERYLIQEGRCVPLAILGPGNFLGTTGIIAGLTHLGHGRVREHSTVLEISASNLKRLINRRSSLALKFKLALCKRLIKDCGRISKRVARTTNQAAINKISSSGVLQTPR